MVCRDLCNTHGVKKTNFSLYEIGMRFCRRCEVFFSPYQNDGKERIHCTCCGMHLRTRTHHRNALSQKEWIPLS